MNLELWPQGWKGILTKSTERMKVNIASKWSEDEMQDFSGAVTRLSLASVYRYL